MWCTQKKGRNSHVSTVRYTAFRPHKEKIQQDFGIFNFRQRHKEKDPVRFGEIIFYSLFTFVFMFDKHFYQ